MLIVMVVGLIWVLVSLLEFKLQGSFGVGRPMGGTRPRQLTGLSSRAPPRCWELGSCGRPRRRPGWIFSSGWCCTNGFGPWNAGKGTGCRTTMLAFSVARSRRRPIISSLGAFLPESFGWSCCHHLVCLCWLHSTRRMQPPGGFVSGYTLMQCFSRLSTRWSCLWHGWFGRRGTVGLSPTMPMESGSYFRRQSGRLTIGWKRGSRRFQ